MSFQQFQNGGMDLAQIALAEYLHHLLKIIFFIGLLTGGTYQYLHEAKIELSVVGLVIFELYFLNNPEVKVVDYVSELLEFLQTDGFYLGDVQKQMFDDFFGTVGRIHQDVQLEHSQYLCLYLSEGV
jgi:hypothetical protein